METSDQIVDEILKHITVYSYVLEPSAGRGKLASAMMYYKDCKVDCIELNRDNYNYLVGDDNTYDRFNLVINKDFLQVPAVAGYDHVAMVPPYKDNQDCEHIIHAYKFIKPGGSVVALTLPYWTTGFYSNQVAFRKWLNDKKFEIKFIEDDKSYVACPKMLLVIKK